MGLPKITWDIFHGFGYGSSEEVSLCQFVFCLTSMLCNFLSGDAHAYNLAIDKERYE